MDKSITVNEIYNSLIAIITLYSKIIYKQKESSIYLDIKIKPILAKVLQSPEVEKFSEEHYMVRLFQHFN